MRRPRGQHFARRRGQHVVRPRLLSSRISRIAGTAALTIAGVAGTTAGVELTNTGSASAQCLGAGAPVLGGLIDPENGQLLASETPLDSCNNDGIGMAALSAAPGWTPVLWESLGNPGNPLNPWGPWTQWYGTQTVSWFAANHQSREFLCAVNDINQSAWCGGTTAIFLPQYTSNVWQMNPPYTVSSGF